MDNIVTISHFLESEDVNDLFFVLRVWRCSPGTWVTYTTLWGYECGYLKDPEPHVAPLLKARKDLHDRSTISRNAVLSMQNSFGHSMGITLELGKLFEVDKVVRWMNTPWMYSDIVDASILFTKQGMFE